MEQRVSEILFYVWDPIGINLNVACRDEYDDYVPIIAAYLLHEYGETRLGALLIFIMESWIGLQLVKNYRRKFRHQQALKILMEWNRYIFSKFLDFKQFVLQFPSDADFSAQLVWSRQQALKRKL